MLSRKKELVIREIWNNRFRIHSLRPLQSSIRQVSQENSGVTKFHVNHVILAPPIPVEFIKLNETTRKRELKSKLISLREIFQLQQIKALTVSEHLPLREAILTRLKQHDIIVTDIGIESLNQNKQLYQLNVLKSPFVNTKDNVRTVIKTSKEDLLGATVLDGVYQSKTSMACLNVTPYPINGRVQYGSMLSWSRFSDKLRVKLNSAISFKLYNTENQPDELEQQLVLLEQSAIFESIDHELGNDLLFNFGNDNTILIAGDKVITLPRMNGNITCLFYSDNVSPDKLEIELSSTE